MDAYMEAGMAIRKIKVAAKKTMTLELSRREIEKAWQVNSALRDAVFLSDSLGCQIVLHHDFVPLDPGSVYHCGHFTAVWKSADDVVRHHTLRVWITCSTDTASSSQAYENMVKYFEALCNRLIDAGILSDEAFFDNSVFVCVVSDRGAHLSGVPVLRIFEPLHRVHAVATLVVLRLNALGWARSICHAAQLVTHPEFEV